MCRFKIRDVQVALPLLGKSGWGACLVCALLASATAEERAYDNDQPHWLASERLSAILGRDADLAKLTRSADAVVATHAAWRRIANQLAKGKGRPPVDPPAETKPEYFVGFLEGRLRLDCPAWWQSAIASAQAREDGQLEFQEQREKRQRDHIKGLVIPPGVAATLRANGDWEVKVGDQVLKIPKQTAADGMANGANSFEVTIEKDLRCVAWCGGHGHVGLMRLNDDGEQWRAMAAGHWDIGAFSGPGYEQRVQLVLIDDAIAVFAATPNVAYVEIFEAATGKRRFRFSTGAYRVENER